jgi:hypothetical protein
VSTFLTAEWRKLIMAQYAVKPKLLMPYLPKDLELDLYNGGCYVSLVAKYFYEEQYAAIPTNHQIELSAESLKVGYGWDLGGRSHTLAVEADPTPQAILPSTEEDFITEHYWGYTKRRDGSTSAYQVGHPRWQTYKPRSHEIALDFGMLYGPSFAFLTDQWVSSVLLAEGSAVSVHSGSRLSA